MLTRQRKDIVDTIDRQFSDLEYVDKELFNLREQKDKIEKLIK
jgi:hypothetical protein